MSLCISKHLVALGLAGAVLATFAAPSLAQDRYMRQAGPYDRGPGGPYAYEEPSPTYSAYKGMRSSAGCWVETDLGRGFGYWGSCGDEGKALGAATGQWRTRNHLVSPR